MLFFFQHPWTEIQKPFPNPPEHLDVRTEIVLTRQRSRYNRHVASLPPLAPLIWYERPRGIGQEAIDKQRKECRRCRVIRKCNFLLSTEKIWKQLECFLSFFLSFFYEICTFSFMCDSCRVWGLFISVREQIRGLPCVWRCYRASAFICFNF